MTQYAYFNSATAAPSPVLGWYDTAEFTYANLPVSGDLLEVTAGQWAARMSGLWAVTNGALVAYTPSSLTPTLAQQANALLAAGLAITSTATSALDATYPTSNAAQQYINAEVTSILLNGTFADGTNALAWLDTSGASHTFTVPQFKTLATAVASFVSACLKCVNGQSTTLPSASATIV